MKIHYPNTYQGMQIAAKIENLKMLIKGCGVGGNPYSRFTAMEKQIVQLEEEARVLMEGLPPEQEKEEELAGDHIPADPHLPESYMEFSLQSRRKAEHVQ